ncbi:YtxH domain-containing protein [Photobacterium chitinilyticum]|uniref:YtxH domain-containing protein n=1 Tax=Photobacterium chitinilyticum TaxID=2485123 RepID=A0A444JNT5_9GAMM|nr:YtxH domain-containing protein [Photobacterium chitinilyticum]RWX54638.1 YtxH domain-containing protein [Photobacterium chitinilyticum]
MLKYIMVALIGIGIYIGVSYKDQIEDAVNSRPMEEVQDMLETATDQVSEKASELTEQFEDLSK